jgi:hypothetical protein
LGVLHQHQLGRRSFVEGDQAWGFTMELEVEEDLGGITSNSSKDDDDA